MKSAFLVLALVLILPLVACSIVEESVDCVFPNNKTSSAIAASAGQGFQFQGIMAVRMDSRFTQEWAYTGLQIRWLVAAWPQGAFTSEEPEFSQLALWISEEDVSEFHLQPPLRRGEVRPKVPVEGLYGANAVAAVTSNLPYIGPGMEHDLIEMRVFNDVFNCTLDLLRQ